MAKYDKLKNTYKIRKAIENRHHIESVRHDGHEVQINVVKSITEDELTKIIAKIKELGYKMFCISSDNKKLWTEIGRLK